MTGVELASVYATRSRSRDACVILVDTSIWVEHLGTGDPHFVALLQNGLVLAHPCPTGDRVLGHLDDTDNQSRLWTCDKRLTTVAVHQD